MEELREDWMQYVTDDDRNGQTLWEIRASFPADFDPSRFPIAVIIEWDYAEDGFPDEATLLLLQALEKHLEPLNAPSGNSLLMHVIRGSGISELCYYVQDYEHFMQALNHSLFGKPLAPLRIEYYRDPCWEYRYSVVQNFIQ